MLKQNKTILILAIVVIILIIGLVFLILQPFKLFSFGKSQAILQQERAEDVNFYDAAMENKDSSLCQQIKNLYTRNLCFKDLAVSQINKELCQNIDNAKDQASCLYRVITEKALAAKDRNICTEIGFEDKIANCQKIIDAQ